MLRLIGSSVLLASAAMAMEPALGETGGADDVGSPPALDTAHADVALESAKSVVDHIRSHGAELMAKEQALCKEEFEGVDEWQATIVGNAAERAKRKAERNADKAALGKAVAGRLASLNKFLDFLKGIRKQLGEHITRTNKLFQAVYDANNQAIGEASEVMKDLGFVVSLPWSPFVTPIILPKKDAMDAEAEKETEGELAAEAEAVEKISDDATGAELEDAAGATGGATGGADEQLEEASAQGQETLEAPAASLMELESTTMAQVSYCKDMDSCKLPYTQAFKLYKLGYQHAKQNKAFFEQERAALGGFRDGLKELIANKEAKRSALEAQQAEIAAKLANPPPGLDALFPLIDQHETIVHKGCGEMKARSDLALKELGDIEDVFNSKGCTSCGSDTNPAEAATGAAEVAEVADPAATPAV